MIKNSSEIKYTEYENHNKFSALILFRFDICFNNK